jgi:hypothetical protein
MVAKHLYDKHFGVVSYVIVAGSVWGGGDSSPENVIFHPKGCNSCVF